MTWANEAALVATFVERVEKLRDKPWTVLGRICDAIGIGVIALKTQYWQDLCLPDERYTYATWSNWCPEKRCELPDYIPDVTGGHASPVQLTLWKVKAIKLMILLERRGYVTRADMKALQISPTRWTDAWHGFLARGDDNRFVRCQRTPDLKAQHPTNWAQIEADFLKWGQSLLFSGSAAA